jgi:hypothetical protein
VAGSTSKKVLVARFDREPVPGFVNQHSFLVETGLELLTLGGAYTRIPITEVKIVYFVRDFNVQEPSPANRIFHTRPKMAGLWTRMHFRDGDIMDGLLPNHLLDLDVRGFTLSLPNPTPNSQRIFVPREALSEMQIIGVVGSPLRQQKKAKTVPEGQLHMFD